MIGSRAWLPLAAPLLALFVLVCAWPAGAALSLAAQSSPEQFWRPGTLIATALWAMAITLVAAIMGWPAGRSLSSPSRSRGWWVLSMSVLALPPYALFAAWWMILSPGNPLFDWAATHGRAAEMRSVTLVLGLAGWCWPLIAAAVAWSRRSRGDPELELRRLDGRPWWRSLGAALRQDAPGLAAGSLAAFAAIFGDTVAFDLAQQPSYGFELRSLEAQGASTPVILAAGLPALGMALLVAIAAAWMISRWREQGAGPVVAPALPWWPGVVGPVVVIAPLLALFLLMTRFAHPSTFFSLYAQGAFNAVLVAVAAALVAALVGAGHCALGCARGAAARVLEAILFGGWVTVAAAPAAVIAGADLSAWNRPWCGSVLVDTPIGLVLAEVGRFGIVAAAIGAAGARMSRRISGALLQIDSPSNPLSLVRAIRPALLGGSLAGGGMVGALSLGEIAVAARLEPPGFDWIASSILNAVHYQQPGTVMVAVAAMAIIGVAACALCVFAVSGVARAGGVMSIAAFSRTRSIALAALIGIPLVAGCRHQDAEGTQRLPDARIIGGPGIADGHFDYPRAIACDPSDGSFLVVDKTARVQRFGVGGDFRGSFRMPEWTNGKPVGITIGEDGTIYVPDTHYQRVIVYDHEGREKLRFGSFGKGPGQFIYLTDVALAPDGTLFVSEYGGHDRIQVFTADGKYIREFGSHGSEPGEFDRPQSIAFSHDGRELFVTDACNHRIQVLDPATGKVLRILSHLGREAGEVAYPWGLEVLADGSLLVAEYGNNRVQRLDPATGASKAILGGAGLGPGQLRWPWAVACDGRSIFIVDSGNNRVQVTPLQAAGG